MDDYIIVKNVLAKPEIIKRYNLTAGDYFLQKHAFKLDDQQDKYPFILQRIDANLFGKARRSLLSIYN